MDLCDWSFGGDDDKVLAPVIEFLLTKDDDFIFCFDDELYSLLHELDTEKIIEQYTKNSDYVGDDEFLYARCAVLAKGKKYFDDIKNGATDFPADLEFESLLYVAKDAWAKKHNAEVFDYPHLPKYFE